MNEVTEFSTTVGAGLGTDPSPKILEWLDRQPDAAPPGISPAEWEYAVRYARGRYENGLAHYRRLFGALGWSGMRRGLDVGSGAGHWAIAFAMDNERATGVDKNGAFVHLANGTARVAGYTGRVQHQVGSVEALPFVDGCFDAVWSHSVLQFCDAEASISELSRVVKPGGQFYCGWSTTGFRLSAIHHRFTTGDRRELGAQVKSYLASVLHRDGIAHTPWPGPQIVTAHELTAICGAFGLSLIRKPGLQDATFQFAGISQTADLLCTRDGDAKSFRAKLIQLPITHDDDIQRYQELVRLGLGKLAYDALRDRGIALTDPASRSLYTLAAMRAGRAQDVAELAENGIDPQVRGLLALDQGRFAEAVGSFRTLPRSHRDRSFLLGVVLLLCGALDDAVAEFEAGLNDNNRPVECGFAALLARVDQAEWLELRQRMVRVLRLLPNEMGALPSEIDALVDGLLHSKT